MIAGFGKDNIETDGIFLFIPANCHFAGCIGNPSGRRIHFQGPEEQMLLFTSREKQGKQKKRKYCFHFVSIAYQVMMRVPSTTNRHIPAFL